KFPFSSRNREECSLRLKSSGKLIIYSQQFQYVYIVADKPDLLLKLTVFNKRALGASPLCEYSIFYCGKPEKISRNPSVAFLRSPAILTLDGGGVLGLSSLKILERLEYELQREVGNSKARLVDCFDLLAGTSTGGIIALGLLSGKSILEMIEMWSDMSSSIFEGSRSVFSGIFFEGYDVSNMKRVLLQSLGDQLLTAYKHPYCFVTTMDVKHNPYQLFLLRNYEHPRAGSNGQQHRGLSTFPIWAAGWATGAAPTYLKGPHADDIENMGFCIEPKVHLVDGAMKVNNPAMVALEEAARMTDKSVAHFIEEDLDLLVSVGTGQEPIRLTQSNSSSKASTLEIILNAGHLLTSTNFTHREVLNLMADTEGTYWRFNTPYIGQIPLDCNDSLQIDLIAKATSSYLMDEKFFDIKRLAKLLANRVLMK
ncbi:phospholipase, patatin family protein, partial [Cardiosporidium cionae]